MPKLCLTLTITYRDDPRLVDLLERTSAAVQQARSARRDSREGSPRHASKPSLSEILAREALEEDEYMVESFDGQSRCRNARSLLLNSNCRRQLAIRVDFVVRHRWRLNAD